MKVLALIPARMGSSRFPGKPMEKINGTPMIGHVFNRVKKCNDIDDVIVATCDKIIFDYVHSIGGTAIMTSNLHERASDRCAEALQITEKEKNISYDIVVMIQGDEPMIEPEMITESLGPFYIDPTVKVTNLVADIENEEEFNDPNCIKVVCDKFSNALYFSRQAIPSRQITKNICMQKQVCVIPFKRDFLIEYTKMDPTPLEIFESVDMMRILENGIKVRMVPTKYQTHAVDTPEDLAKVAKLMNDKN